MPILIFSLKRTPGRLCWAISYRQKSI